MRLPIPGDIFQNKYEIVSVLGRGGFATVYKATDPEVGRDVAIKILIPDVDGYEAGLVSRFSREARVIAGLRDPHTITMFDFGKSAEGLLYMVFEYVEGMDLAEKIEWAAPFDDDQVAHVLRQVLEALREAHIAGILHRDIKPANILIYEYMRDDLRVKLLDFGIAKPAQLRGKDAVATLTREGTMVGTPRYMAPEQIYGEEMSPASDLYSLGLVAHEMYVGRPAITGQETKEILQQQLSPSPLRLPIDARVSPFMRNVVERMVAREPSQRFQSADEVLQLLSQRPRSTMTPAPAPADYWSNPANRGAQMSRDVANSRRGAPSGRMTPREVPAAPFKSPQQRRAETVSTIAVIAVGVIGGGSLIAGMFALAGDDPPSKVPEREVVAPTTSVAEEPREVTPPEEAPLEVEVEPEEATVFIEEPPEAAQTGCGSKAPFERQRRYQISAAGDLRYWVAYLPTSYDPSRPHPVVMMFHDHTRSADLMLDDTSIRPVADEHGFVVLALDALRADSPWKEDGEVTFVRRALEKTSEELCLDPRRVYAIGHNTAGRFVEDSACELPWSAIVTSSFRGSKNHRPCIPENHVPYLHFAGLKDRYVPVEGGVGCAGLDAMSLDRKESIWFEGYECSGERSEWVKEKNGVCWTKECPEDAKFVTCHLDGGRDWPNATSRLIELSWCHVRGAQFPMAETAWKFFEEHGVVRRDDELMAR